MIEKVVVRNYQSHETTILYFCSGINILIGKSDSGKSAFMRAIRWVITNRPLGDDNMSRWADMFSCSIKTMDGKKVIRKKEKGFNGYIVEGKEFDGMGTAVPKQVDSVLNLEDINFQSQFDNHFLLSTSPGAIAEYLNTVVDLQVIDDSIDRVNKRLRKASKTIKNKEQEIEETKESLKQLEYLDSLGEEIKEIELLETHSNLKEVDLLDLVDRFNEIIEKRSIFCERYEGADYEKGIKAVESIGLLIGDLEKLEIKHKELQRILGNYKELRENIKENRACPAATKEIEEIETDIKKITEKEKRLKQISEVRYEIFSNKQVMNNICYGIELVNKELKKYKYAACPLCGCTCKCKEKKDEETA